MTLLFAPIPGEALPGVIETPRTAVLVGFLLAYDATQFADALLDERRDRSSSSLSVSQEPANSPAPLPQPIEQLLKM